VDSDRCDHTDVIFDNPTDTDRESLTANMHDKLRRIALYTLVNQI